MNMMEIFCAQQAIIDLQSKVINDLYLQLMQYITPEEADSMDCVAKIDRVAKLKAMIEK